MTKLAKTTKKLNLHDTLIKVKESLSLLPGGEERQRISQIIPEIIKELEALQENINLFPGESETNQVSCAIHLLVSFFDSLKEKPLLAETLFPKAKRVRKTKVSMIDIDALLKQLEGLHTEKIVGELSRHRKDTLQALSSKLNITASTRLTKDALVDKIFKLGFANKRGYDLLSGKQVE